jgi:hypothetical protein
MAIKLINRKAKGTAWERTIINLLEAHGYKCTRAAGSMGAWDIIAFDDSHLRLIQAKCNSACSPAERATLAAFPTPPHTLKEIWRKDDRKGLTIYECDRKAFFINPTLSTSWNILLKNWSRNSRKPPTGAKRIKTKE